LVQAGFGDRAVTGAVDVGAVVGSRVPSVEPDAEAHRRPGRRRDDQVEVPGLEAAREASAGLLGGRRLGTDRPAAREGPVPEPQPLRRGVGLRPVRHDVGGGGEPGGPVVAEVGLRGAERVPVGGGLDAAGVDRRGCGPEVAGTGLAEELPQDRLVLLVAALAEAVVAEASSGVDQVPGRPEVVAEGAPDREVVVDGDGVADGPLPHGPADVVHVVLEGELR
jgi:hypothetical protein